MSASPASISESALTTNVRLYPWYQSASSVLPWLPVFFLYFNQYVTLSDALRLGAIYYLAVFILEVPSGYLSDKLGRRAILLMSSVFLLLAYGTFLWADNFDTLLVAQLFLAAGIAFQSGSDSALLYDSLAALSRESEYTRHEARSQQYSMIALALSTLAGGILGSFNLALPYAMATVAAFATLLLTWKFSEPMASKNSNSFVLQLGQCLKYLTDLRLLWITCFFLLSYALAHVPYEFYQPYIRLLGDFQITAWLAADSAPLVAGIVTAISMSGGAIGAAVSVPLTERFKLKAVLLGSLVMQCVIIGAMALLLHPAILLLVMCRGFPMSLVHGPMMGVIAPLIDTNHRATFLSIQSLINRLSFSMLLFVLSALSGAGLALMWGTLSQLIMICLGVGLMGFIMLAISSRHL
ncbi:MAG: MFS transporter [Granulosicoccus sp.]|nr:MFS transporter [Granulosicoccus sp.]